MFSFPYDILCTIALSHNDMPSGGVYREDGGLAAWRPADWVPRQWGQHRTESLISPVRHTHKAAGGISFPFGKYLSSGMTIRYRDGVMWGIPGDGGDGTKCRRGTCRFRVSRCARKWKKGREKGVWRYERVGPW